MAAFAIRMPVRPKMESRITCRRRAAGRRVVYGFHYYTSAHAGRQGARITAGRLLAPEDDPARAVRDTADELIRRAETVRAAETEFDLTRAVRDTADELIRRAEQDCIADFPPQKTD